MPQVMYKGNDNVMEVVGKATEREDHAVSKEAPPGDERQCVH